MKPRATEASGMSLKWIIAIGVLLLAMLSVALLASRTGQRPASGFDPVAMDPPAFAPPHGASMEAISFDVAGARLNGLWLRAAGPGPFPTVIFLHGFPGNEKNLDVAQAVRRAGYNVLFFHYRGAWGSGGEFSFGNALADAREAVRQVRSQCDGGCDHRAINADQIAVFGHSMGGWLALQLAAEDPAIACTMALDFWNLGEVAAHLKAALASTGSRAPGWVNLEQYETGPGAPLNTREPGALHAELNSDAAQWELVDLAGELAQRNLFLLSIDGNQQHQRLVAAIDAAQGRRLQEEQWTTDHSFNDRRVALTRATLDWLSKGCGF